MKKKLLFQGILCITIVSPGIAQTGNYVSSNSEAVNSGTINLATPGGQVWSTARTATPGYFAAVGTASFTGAADASTQLIDGYVKSYATAADQAFTFPVGAGNDLRTIQVSGTRSATSIIGTAWVPGDPTSIGDVTNAGSLHNVASFGGSITQVSDAGQWDWVDISNNAAGTTITVSIPDVTSLSGVADSLRLVGWSQATSQWIALGTTGSTSKAEGSVLIGTMQTGIEALGIGIAGTPLPISLASFSAKKYNPNSAKLDWITLSEENAKGFEIERNADGGSTWTSIGFIATQAQRGQSHTTLNYTTYDNSPLYEKNYYRLKMIDLNGKYVYSKVAQLTFDDMIADEVKVYPNPGKAANPGFHVLLTTTYTGNAEIIITNLTGQRILNQKISVTKGVNHFVVNTNQMAVGSYFIQVKTDVVTIGPIVKLVML